MVKGFRVALLVFAFTACAPPTSSPTQLMALELTPQGVYRPQQVQLTTLANAIQLKGSVATLIGSAKIVLDYNDPLLQGNLTDGQVTSALIKSNGSAPTANYIQQGAVLWPSDFDTWNMVTTYYNFEKAYRYFHALQVSDEVLSPADVYYFPSFLIPAVSQDPQKDNALFFAAVGGFMILPFDTYQSIPLAMNGGVIGHEYSHRVMNRLVFEGQASPDPYAAWGSSYPLNILKSLDEGFADYNGWGTTCLSPNGCNTRYLEYSLSRKEADNRDYELGHCLTSDLATALNSYNFNDFNSNGFEYRLGALFGTALYQAGKLLNNHDIFRSALIASYSDANSSNPGLHELIYNNLTAPGAFTLDAVANVLINHLSDLRAKQLLCNQLSNRLQIPPSLLTACPQSTLYDSTCPTLTPAN